MAFQRGDVVLVPFPFTDLSAAKTRPAVIVSGAGYHRSTRDLILLEITSHLPSSPLPATYPLRGWQQAGLKKRSVAKVVLFTLEESQIVHAVGRLTPDDMAGVDNLLRNALDL
jgi:mRNA interferase MazF